MDSPWLTEWRKKELSDYLGRGDLLPAQRDTLLRLDAQWARKGLTLGSRVTYARKGLYLARFLEKPFEEATRKDLEAYLDTMIDRAPKSVTDTKLFLKTFYKSLFQPDEPGHPPIVSWIRVKPPGITLIRKSDLLTAEDVKAIAEHTDHPRDRAMVMVLYESAARASELLNLHVRDVEFDDLGARITLRGKTGSRQIRLITSVPDLQLWLQHHPLRGKPDAPLWTSWGRQNYHQALLHHGLAVVLATAVQRAGITKRVHPHLFRHSRLHVLNKVLMPSERKVFAGWTRDSNMLKVYDHLECDDVEEKLLRHAGVAVPKEQPKEDPLRLEKCLRCGHMNSSVAEYCQRCTMPLDERTAIEWAQQQELLRKNLAKLVELAEAQAADG